MVSAPSADSTAAGCTIGPAKMEFEVCHAGPAGAVHHCELARWVRSMHGAHAQRNITILHPLWVVARIT